MSFSISYSLSIPFLQFYMLVFWILQCGIRMPSFNKAKKNQTKQTTNKKKKKKKKEKEKRKEGKEERKERKGKGGKDEAKYNYPCVLEYESDDTSFSLHQCPSLEICSFHKHGIRVVLYLLCRQRVWKKKLIKLI
jgi:hypothetical protein